MIFETDDKVSLNERGIKAFSNAPSGVDWKMRRGLVDKGNPRGGGEVLVTWFDCKGPTHVPSEYLRKWDHVKGWIDGV